MLFRIRKLSLNFLGPDEDRPLVNPTNESIPNPFFQQLPSIVIEQPVPSLSNDSTEQQQRRRTSSNTSDNNDTTKL